MKKLKVLRWRRTKKDEKSCLCELKVSIEMRLEMNLTTATKCF